MEYSDTDALRDWWVDIAHKEVEAITDKMSEYGGAGRAVDLIDIGRDLLRAMAAPAAYVESEELCAEVGIYFYLRGKIARWTAALVEGRRVSDDTLHDIGVYARMAQRVRETGGWPV